MVPDESAPAIQMANPMSLLQAALDKGLQPDNLGKLMDLAERWEANQAAAAYSRALTAFQAECPQVHKGRPVLGKDRQTVRYSFAGYDDIMATIGPLLAKHGICIDFQMPTSADVFRVVMRVRVGAYYEDKEFTAPMPDLAKLAAATYMTEPQAFGTVLSYYKRYCLCAGLNVSVTNEDTDAQSVPDGGITSDEVKEVENLIMSKGRNRTRFLEWAGVRSIRDMDRATYRKAIDMLQRAQPVGATP